MIAHTRKDIPSSTAALRSMQTARVARHIQPNTDRGPAVVSPAAMGAAQVVRLVSIVRALVAAEQDRAPRSAMATSASKPMQFATTHRVAFRAADPESLPMRDVDAT
jgi:hypothetical protein